MAKNGRRRGERADAERVEEVRDEARCKQRWHPGLGLAALVCPGRSPQAADEYPDVKESEGAEREKQDDASVEMSDLHECHLLRERDGTRGKERTLSIRPDQDGR